MCTMSKSILERLSSPLSNLNRPRPSWSLELFFGLEIKLYGFDVGWHIDTQ